MSGRQRRRIATCVVAVWCLAACAVEGSRRPRAPEWDRLLATQPDEHSVHHVRPRLGVGFGQLVAIVATVEVVPDKGGPVPTLRVHEIAGEQLTADRQIEWTYGSWTATAVLERGRDGLVLEAGGRYRLVGFEAGGFEGSSNSVGRYLLEVDELREFGPPATRNFHFRSIFRVLGGERLH